MIVSNNQITFETGREIFCKKEMFCLSENGFLKVVSHDSVIQSYELSYKELTELKQFYENEIRNLNDVLLNSLNSDYHGQ